MKCGDFAIYFQTDKKERHSWFWVTYWWSFLQECGHGQLRSWTWRSPWPSSAVPTARCSSHAWTLPGRQRKSCPPQRQAGSLPPRLCCPQICLPPFWSRAAQRPPVSVPSRHSPFQTGCSLDQEHGCSMEYCRLQPFRISYVWRRNRAILSEDTNVTSNGESAAPLENCCQEWSLWCLLDRGDIHGGESEVVKVHSVHRPLLTCSLLGIFFQSSSNTVVSMRACKCWAYSEVTSSAPTAATETFPLDE